MNIQDFHTSTNHLPYLGIRYQIRYHKCNLNCPYCIARWKDRENLFDLETFKGIVKRIKELPYRVCLRIGVGGEIFTSPDILEVIKGICNEDNNIFGVSFSSNLQADWDKVIGPFIESTNTSKLGMGCTLHDMVIKNVDMFFERVNKLKKSGVLLYVGYVAIPQRIHFIKQYKQKCQEFGVPLLLNALLGKLVAIEGANPDLQYPRDYTVEEIRQLKELWDTPHSYKLLLEACSTRGMTCSAGKNYIFIDHEGNVLPCRNIKSDLGNILQSHIHFRETDTICPVDSCWCGNENQALRIVDRYYDRTRTLRIFYPKKDIPEKTLYQVYNPSIFQRNMMNPKLQFKKFLSSLRF